LGGSLLKQWKKSMNSTPQTTSILASAIAFAFLLLIIYFAYRLNLHNLNACKSPQEFKPNKLRFVVAWSVYSFCLSAPLIVILWFVGKEFPAAFVLTLFLVFLLIAPSAYPYYTLARFETRINGATLWGWYGRRTEIDFKDIDVSKASRQRLGIVVGVFVFHSTRGIKILTLGLDERQIADILKSSNEIVQHG
jgi:hypothetical protein